MVTVSEVGFCCVLVHMGKQGRRLGSSEGDISTLICRREERLPLQMNTRGRHRYQNLEEMRPDGKQLYRNAPPLRQPFYANGFHLNCAGTPQCSSSVEHVIKLQACDECR